MDTPIDFITVSNDRPGYGSIELNVALAGDANDPLIVCVHGWPETWHSWRHQMEHFAARGWRMAAFDVRGYGDSSRPEPIDAYRLTELCSDVAAVIDHLSPDQPAIVFGHDWGAVISWNTARLHPEKVRAVAGLSVPYNPITPGDPVEFWNLIYEGRFFYQVYFQEPGVVEAAFDADVGASLRKIYYAASGDAPPELWGAERPPNYPFLDDLIDPDPAPAWMSPDEIGPTIAAHSSGGMHGAFNRYRAQGMDGDEIPGIGDPVLRQPTCFIGGERDIVRSMVPGVDVFLREPEALADFRGTTIIPGAGHWVQQEQPDLTNAALEQFLSSLNEE